MTTETNPLDNRQGVKHTGASKTARIPIKVVPLEEKLKKPEWIRAKLPNPKKFFEIKDILREQKMHTVCEEAACPNISECFSKGTATFMIMGDMCTRRRTRKTKPARSRRTAKLSQLRPRHETALRRHHIGRPGRLARRGGTTLCRLHYRHPRSQPHHQNRNPGT